MERIVFGDDEESGRPGRSGRRKLRENARGLGGFYEAILSLMVVTLGVMLLTASFALLSADDAASAPEDLYEQGRELMDRLLSNTTLFREDRMVERPDLVHFFWSGLPSSDGPPGVRIMITERGGGTEVLYRSGDPGKMSERASLGEPVSVWYSPGDVRPASLTVWVWR